MFVTNPEKIENKVECRYTVAKYLIYKGVPLLGIDGNKFYFADTELTKQTLEDAPYIIKLMYSWKK